jgi:hypothetical protein
LISAGQACLAAKPELLTNAQAVADFAAFQTLQTNIATYLADEPSMLRAAAQMNAGQALQRELAPWHQRIANYGCASPPAPAALPVQPTGLLDVLKGSEDLVEKLLIAYVAWHLLGGLRKRR